MKKLYVDDMCCTDAERNYPTVDIYDDNKNDEWRKKHNTTRRGT